VSCERIDEYCRSVQDRRGRWINDNASRPRAAYSLAELLSCSCGVGQGQRGWSGAQLGDQTVERRKKSSSFWQPPGTPLSNDQPTEHTGGELLSGRKKSRKWSLSFRWEPDEQDDVPIPDGAQQQSCTTRSISNHALLRAGAMWVCLDGTLLVQVLEVDDTNHCLLLRLSDMGVCGGLPSIEMLQVEWQGASSKIEAVRATLREQRRMNLHDFREHEAGLKMLKVYNSLNVACSSSPLRGDSVSGEKSAQVAAPLSKLPSHYAALRKESLIGATGAMLLGRC